MAEYLLPDKAVSYALSQVGYKEGSGNWNKYAQELDSINYFAPQKKQGVAWCNIFVDDVIYNASGKDKSKTQKALYQPSYDNLSAACPYAARYFRNNGAWSSTPQVGAQIFFGKVGSETHTGLVVAVGVSTITTVEGNKGNTVQKCSYSKSNSNIAGYGLIKYDTAPQPTPPTPTKDEYKVTTNSGDALRLRKEPTTKSIQVGYIPNGKTVKADAVVKGESIGGCEAWVKTTYNGAQGYASGKYLTPTPQIDPDPEPTPTPTPPTPTGTKYKVKTNSGVALRMREKPNATAKQVGWIDNGQTVLVESITDGWGYVNRNGAKGGGAQKGYSSMKYLKKV